MRAKIDAQKFKDIKYAVKHAPTLGIVAAKQKVSLETIRRVKNAKTFLEYQANNAKRVSTSKPGTVVKPTVRKRTQVNPAKMKDNRKWWEKLLNI